MGEASWARTAAKVAFFVPSAQATLDYSKYSQAFFNIGTANASSTSATFNLSASYDIFSARKFTDLSTDGGGTRRGHGQRGASSGTQRPC